MRRQPAKRQREKWREAAERMDKLTLLAALKDAVAFMDRMNGGKDGQQWTVKDVKRIEEIRLLSLGV